MPEASDQKYLTLILGAGASVAYGLPTGDELVRRVAERMQNDDASDVQRLGHKLELYDPISIDTYLMRYYSEPTQKNDLESYKAYIAYEIMHSMQEAWHGKTDSEKKFNAKNKENWLRFLIPELLNLYERDPSSECPIKIITFNYDLAIEFYLQRIIAQHVQTKDFKDGFFRWVSGSIIHMYGQVGGYYWQKCDQNTFNIWQNIVERMWTNGKSRLNKEDFLRLGYDFQRNIQVIGEPNRALDGHVQQAKQWIAQSKTLLITGYAYHADNNKLLDLEIVGKNANHIIAGVYGAHKKLKDRVEKLFSSGIHPQTKTYYNRVKNFDESQPNNPLLSIYDLTTYDILRYEVTLSELYG